VFAKRAILLADTAVGRRGTQWLGRLSAAFGLCPGFGRQECLTHDSQKHERCCRKLAFAVNDPALCQIVRRKFDPNPVARHNTDEVLSHPTGNVGQNNVSTFDLNAKTSIGEGLRHNALNLKCFFLLFCHKSLWVR
jgi:hypothetical protein